MKTSNRIFSIIAAVALALSVSAQQSVHDNYIGVNFSGGLNTMLYKPANGQYGLGFGFDAGIHYARFFNHCVGLGFGASYSWANAYATYNWKEVTTGLTHPSNPKTKYNLITGFNDFVERQNVGVVSIPVELLLRKELNNRAAFIAGFGVSLDLPIHGAYYTQNGSYSTTGVFPAIGKYEIKDMPEHGFSTHSTTQNAKFNNRATVGGSAILDLGFRIAFNDHWGMYIGLNAGYGFTNLLANAKTEEMIMINPTDPSVIDYRGTFESNETSKANLLHAGLRIAFDFGWSKLAEDKPAKEQLPAIDEEAERLARDAAAREAAEREAAEQAAREAERRVAEQAEREAAEQAAREKAIQDSIASVKVIESAEVKALKEQIEKINFYYETNQTSVHLTTTERRAFMALCELMKKDPSIRIVITGHTDNTGSAARNLRYYGMKRAESLKSYMMKKGVPANQITCESKGQTEPIAPNDTEENRAKNRRAKIRFE